MMVKISPDNQQLTKERETQQQQQKRIQYLSCKLEIEPSVSNQNKTSLCINHESNMSYSLWHFYRRE